MVRCQYNSSLHQGVHFSSLPRVANIQTGYMSNYSQTVNYYKALNSERISTSLHFHHHAFYSVFKHFILSAIVLQCTAEMLNCPKHLFYFCCCWVFCFFAPTKQKPSIQFKFGKSYLQSPLFSLGNNNNSWTWELNTPFHSCKDFHQQKPEHSSIQWWD